MQDYGKMRTIIKLQRGPCFGPCPIYKVTIYGNGTVIYIGKEFVKTKGKHKINIGDGKIRELISEFEKIHYFQLKGSYEDEEVSCSSTTITSIAINGKTKTIRHYHGDSSAPEKLTYLEDKIDEIINSNQWIK